MRDTRNVRARRIKPTSLSRTIVKRTNNEKKGFLTLVKVNVMRAILKASLSRNIFKLEGQWHATHNEFSIVLLLYIYLDGIRARCANVMAFMMVPPFHNTLRIKCVYVSHRTDDNIVSFRIYKKKIGWKVCRVILLFGIQNVPTYRLWWKS